MKKTLIASFFTIVMSGGAAAVDMPAANENASGSIEFSGRVVKAPCTLNSFSKEQSIPLGDISLSALQQNTNRAVAFSIRLDDCVPSQLAPVVTFSSNGQGNAGEYVPVKGELSNSVAVALYDYQGNFLPVGTSYKSVNRVGTGSNELPFSARLVKRPNADIAKMKAGEFRAEANFMVTYQ